MPAIGLAAAVGIWSEDAIGKPTYVLKSEEGAEEWLFASLA